MSFINKNQPWKRVRKGVRWERSRGLSMLFFIMCTCICIQHNNCYCFQWLSCSLSLPLLIPICSMIDLLISKCDPFGQEVSVESLILRCLLCFVSFDNRDKTKRVSVLSLNAC